MNDKPIPLPAQWNGEAFVVPEKFRPLADRYYVIGEVYKLVEEADRSVNSHNHYFAVIAEAWQNLPVEWVERFPTTEHLRKYALVKCGYADERTYVCDTKADAQRLAAFIRPLDTFAVILTQENCVKVFTAQSQSKKAMGAKVFQASKQAVIDYLAKSLLGIEPDQLTKNAGRAA